MRKLVYEIIIGDIEYKKSSKGIEDFAEYFEGQILRMLANRLDQSTDPYIKCYLIEDIDV
tara:strand:+ start:609 stop:788 length:180 start_codon:yes stop_codon:yes gene_type:complete